MYKNKNGNPKRSSRFICIKHLGENYLGAGIQRRGHQREKFHVKNLYCLHCKSISRCLEIRWCDTYDEIFDKAVELKEEYYPENQENIKVESEVNYHGTDKRLCD